jgi:hypothetical protein
MSDYPTIAVMKSDVPSSAPPPPRPAPPGSARPADIPLADARSRSVEELVGDLERVLRSGHAALELTPGADGTPGIPSLVAVWLLTEVGKAIGADKPVDLSKVTDRQELRTVGGVARLLHRTFHPVSHGAVA